MMTTSVKAKLSVSGIGIGIVLILLGFFESNFLSSDAEKFFSGSGREVAWWLLAAGTVIVSAGVLAFARAVTE
jgi:hypothetical protein